jgi:hypothetical protein
MIGTWISAREQGENPTVNHSLRAGIISKIMKITVFTTWFPT